MADLVERLELAGSNSALSIGDAWVLLDEAAAELRRLAGGVAGEVMEVGSGEDGVPRVLIHTTEDELRAAPPLVYRQVRLLPMPEAS